MFFLFLLRIYLKNSQTKVCTTRALLVDIELFNAQKLGRDDFSRLRVTKTFMLLRFIKVVFLIIKILVFHIM